MDMSTRFKEQIGPYEKDMSPHHFNLVSKCSKLAIAQNQEDFRQRLIDYRYDVVNSGLFNDIVDTLKDQRDQLEHPENDPASLDEEQRIAALNFLFSNSTKSLRYGDYMNSFRSLVT